MNRHRVYEVVKNIAKDAGLLGGITRLGFDALEAILVRYGVAASVFVRWSVVGLVGVATSFISGRNTLQDFAAEDARLAAEETEKKLAEERSRRLDEAMAKSEKRGATIDTAIKQQVTTDRFDTSVRYVEHKIIKSIRAAAAEVTETVKRHSPNNPSTARKVQRATRSAPTQYRRLVRANSVPRLGLLPTIPSAKVSSSSSDEEDEKKRKSKSPAESVKRDSANDNDVSSAVAYVAIDMDSPRDAATNTKNPLRPR